MPEESIFDLPKERLELIDHDVYKWICCAEGCTNGTHVWDFGEEPKYYFPRRTKGAAKGQGSWLISKYWYWACGKHSKMEKRGIPFKKKEVTVMEGNLVFIKSITVTDIKFKL